MTTATNTPGAAKFNLGAMSDELLNRLIGKPTLQADEATNDSDKTLVVPADTTWEILNIRAELIATATVGNRQMRLEIQDSASDIIYEHRHQTAILQAASATRIYNWAPGSVDLAALIETDTIFWQIPRLILPEASIIRIYDINAVDAAADDLVLQAIMLERVEI